MPHDGREADAYYSLSKDGDIFADQVDNFLRFTGAEPLE